MPTVFSFSGQCMYGTKTTLGTPTQTVLVDRHGLVLENYGF
jgi:hypothetical protein